MNMVVAAGEADVHIGQMLQINPQTIVFSKDSDLIGGYTSTTIITSEKNNKFRTFNKADILHKLDLSENQFILFNCILKNDYSAQPKGVGGSSNIVQGFFQIKEAFGWNIRRGIHYLK